jgi:hypothetical protein
MEQQPGRDPTQESLAALERLVEKHVITQVEAQAAARLLTGDATLVFPPPRAPAVPAPAPAPAPAPSDAAPGEAQSDAGSS